MYKSDVKSLERRYVIDDIPRLRFLATRSQVDAKISNLLDNAKNNDPDYIKHLSMSHIAGISAVAYATRRDDEHNLRVEANAIALHSWQYVRGLLNDAQLVSRGANAISHYMFIGDDELWQPVDAQVFRNVRELGATAATLVLPADAPQDGPSLTLCLIDDAVKIERSIFPDQQAVYYSVDRVSN